MSASAALEKKLGIKPGHKVVGFNAPFDTQRGSSGDVVLLFVNDSAQLEKELPKALKALKPGGLFWIGYLKGGKQTDLNRDILRERLATQGWAGVSLVAVDDKWSAMRFKPAT